MKSAPTRDAIEEAKNLILCLEWAIQCVCDPAHATAFISTTEAATEKLNSALRCLDDLDEAAQPLGRAA